MDALEQLFKKKPEEPSVEGLQKFLAKDSKGPDLSSVASNMKQKKVEVAGQLSTTGVAVKPKDVTKSAFADAKKKADQAAAKDMVAPSEKPAAVEKAEEIQAKDPKKLTSGEKIYLALAAALPTVIGAAFGGSEGAAIGAKTTGGLADSFAKQKAEDAKSAREQQEKLELAKLAASEKAALAEKELAAKSEAAKLQFGTQQAIRDAAQIQKSADKEIAKSKDSRDFEQSLRKEYQSNPVIKAEAETNTSIAKIQKAAEADSPAGDLSLIFSYMKVLDPGSTVREGEFANAQNAGSVPDKIQNIYNRVASGKRLTPDQRKDFVSQAMNLAQAQRQQAEILRKGYKLQAEKFGLSPEAVIFNPYAQESAAAQFPKTVYDGKGKSATVSNQQELNEAQAEGFR